MDDEGPFVSSVPRRHEIPHYHGDSVRILFVIGALIIIVAKSTGAELPLNTFEAVTFAVVLVIAAGITSPGQRGIHWLNAALAVLATIVFGTSAVSHYRAGLTVFDSSFIYIEALALLSLISLYLTTRTIRGLRLHDTV